MNTIIKLLAPAYLGYSLHTFANISLEDWEFYAIIIPFFLIDGLAKIIEDLKKDN